jgi:acetyl esterase/lipase
MISAFSSYSQKEVFLWEDSVKINNPSDFPHENYKEERYIYTKNNTLCIRKVTNPTLTIFLADSSINTGAAVIICPGGGMNTIVFEHEGTIIAEEFVKLGINAFVLKYRHYNRNVAISDIKQAISYVRENAMSMGINDKAIGIGGFSAGGRMSLETTYQLINMDTTQCNIGIDFLMFVYTRTQIIENAVVNKCFPPSFMLVTADDFRYKMNLEFAEILDNNKIPFELHVFQKGLHGFGLGKGLCNCDIWPQLFYQWLSNNNFINTKG